VTHILKSYPQYFDPTIQGLKTHEIRSNSDTGPFSPGDTLILREYDPKIGRYTGRVATTVITYVSPIPKPWIVPEFWVFSAKMLGLEIKAPSVN